MELNYRTRTGRMLFKLEAKTSKEMVRLLAEIQGTFESETLCGLCNSDLIQFQVRNPPGAGEYYELVCMACTATLTFGQHRSGESLFLRRPAGAANRGWKLYRREESSPREEEFAANAANDPGF